MKFLSIPLSSLSSKTACAVVPEPAKLSRTISPSLVAKAIHYFTKDFGFGKSN